MQDSQAAWIAFESVAGILLLGVGLAFLRLRWLRWRGMGRIGVLAGWLFIAAGITVLGHAWGIELGIVYGITALCTVAYLIVALGVELREPKERANRALAPEPEERPTNWPRAVAKSFLAIVLAGVAAIGIGVAFAVAMPMVPKDRILIGGILVPILWGAGMAWTLSDARLIRATVLLIVISVAAYGVAFLPKMLS